MKTIAIYPGTFDPVTNGHADIVARATVLFEQVIVAIAKNPSKKPAFTIEERVEMATTVFTDYRQVEVCAFDGLLVTFAQQRGAGVILRGLRAMSDFEYEFQMAGMNRRLGPETETLFLTPAEQYTFISSSLVREIAALGGDVSNFVHPVVAGQLQQRMR